MNLQEFYDTLKRCVSQDDLKLPCREINIILILQMNILRKENILFQINIKSNTHAI